jgi:hypothetical protein
MRETRQLETQSLQLCSPGWLYCSGSRTVEFLVKKCAKLESWKCARHSPGWLWWLPGSVWFSPRRRRTCGRPGAQSTQLDWCGLCKQNRTWCSKWDGWVYSRAVDPDSLSPDTDQDPAFQVNPIRIQGFDDQKLKKKKNSAENFDYLFLKSKIAIYYKEEAFSPPKRTSSTSKNKN